MIVTGTISRYASEWGIERLTQQGRRFLRPVIGFRSPVVSHYRRDQYWAEKLIFKKLCMRLEAVVDTDGTYASMNTNFVLPGDLDLYAVAAIANSTLLSWIYEGYFGALRMGGGFMQAQAPQLRVLPIAELPIATREELEQLVPADLALNDLCVPPDDADQQLRLYALLRFAGRAAHTASLQIAEVKLDLVSELLSALSVTNRREHDPSFVLPRQEAILRAALDPAATDLSRFWTPMRRTARQMGVEITRRVEEAILQAVRGARESSSDPLNTRRLADALIDDLVFVLYGLSEEQAAKVRRGHAPPPGTVADEQA